MKHRRPEIINPPSPLRPSHRGPFPTGSPAAGPGRPSSEQVTSAAQAPSISRPGRRRHCPGANPVYNQPAMGRVHAERSGQATTSFFMVTTELVTDLPGGPGPVLGSHCPHVVTEGKMASSPGVPKRRKSLVVKRWELSSLLPLHVSPFPPSASQPLSPQPFPLQDPVLPSVWEGLHRCGGFCSVRMPTSCKRHPGPVWGPLRA